MAKWDGMRMGKLTRWMARRVAYESGLASCCLGCDASIFCLPSENDKILNMDEHFDELFTLLCYLVWLTF